jgi:hypothetical protein
MLEFLVLKVQNFVEEQEQGVFQKALICGQLLVFQPCNSFIAYLHHSFGTSR